jgi:hypothetical protein
MCGKTSKSFSREEKRVAIELWRAKVPLMANFEKSFGLCQEKSWHFGCWMSDSDYLKKLVESTPRRLADTIDKKGTTTGY